MMKKLGLIFLFIGVLIFLFEPTPVSAAAGDQCCPAGKRIGNCFGTQGCFDPGGPGVLCPPVGENVVAMCGGRATEACEFSTNICVAKPVATPPAGAAATAQDGNDCSDPIAWDHNKRRTEPASVACGPTECSKPGAGGDALGHYCYPKGPTSASPGCEPGLAPVDALFDLSSSCSGFENMCCVHTSNRLHCRNKETPDAAIRDCKDIAAYALLGPRKTCQPTFRLNETTNVCLKYKANLWDLNLTTCQGTQGVDTAIGCVPTGKLDLTLSFVLKFVLGAAGGVMVLMLIATGYSLLTSQGNPEKLAAAKENIVSIFSGLILIVFSLVLLQTIGANILGLPGF